MNNKVTTHQLTGILNDKGLINGITFVGFDTLTVPKLKGGKGNPHQGRITKLATGFIGMIASNKVSSAYEIMVNRRLLEEGKEADFKAGKLPWGQRVEGTCLIENKGVYLEVIPDEKLVFTDTYTAGWKPAPDPFMTAIILFEDAGEGQTRYTAIARHRTPETRAQHEAMGFHEGWGTVVSQLEDYAQRLLAR